MRFLLLLLAASCGTSGGLTDAGADASSSDVQGNEASTDAPNAKDAADASDAASAYWQPGTGSLPWQWELDHTIVTTSATDMGTGDKTYSGGNAADPVVYDIDGFDNSSAEVSAFHGLGKKVICYIEVGAAENFRSDYSQFPTAALGTSVPSYPTEKYLDIGNATVVTVIKARIAMCAQKGFDGVEPDIDDSYTDSTGFTITEASNVAYLTTLSDYAHSLGLAWGLKNGGDGGTPDKFIADMLPHIDFAVVEEPFFLATIGFFSPALYNAGKAMFVAEYTNDTASAMSFCPQALTDHTNAALFDVALDAMTRTPCQ
jgi:endo-alpha-1,4-polygalactosaminidase (GH114 family)